MISSGSFGGPCTNKERILTGYLGIVWGNCLVADGQLTTRENGSGAEYEITRSRPNVNLHDYNHVTMYHVPSVMSLPEL